MNLLDIIFIAIVIISALFGIYRGFTKEILSLVVWVLAFAIAAHFGRDLLILEQEYINFLGGYIASETFRFWIIFALFVLFNLIIGSLLVNFLSRLVNQCSLAGLNRFLGMLFGALRGVILISLIATVMELTQVGSESEFVKESKMITPLYKSCYYLFQNKFLIK